MVAFIISLGSIQTETVLHKLHQIINRKTFAAVGCASFSYITWFWARLVLQVTEINYHHHSSEMYLWQIVHLLGDHQVLIITNGLRCKICKNVRHLDVSQILCDSDVLTVESVMSLSLTPSRSDTGTRSQTQQYSLQFWYTGDFYFGKTTTNLEGLNYQGPSCIQFSSCKKRLL